MTNNIKENCSDLNKKLEMLQGKYKYLIVELGKKQKENEIHINKLIRAKKELEKRKRV